MCVCFLVNKSYIKYIYIYMQYTCTPLSLLLHDVVAYIPGHQLTVSYLCAGNPPDFGRV